MVPFPIPNLSMPVNWLWRVHVHNQSNHLRDGHAKFQPRKLMNQLDFVWVPTEFLVSTFIESGVDPSKVVKIVQPVNVSFFDPLNYKPYHLALIRKLELGKVNSI